MCGPWKKALLRFGDFIAEPIGFCENLLLVARSKHALQRIRELWLHEGRHFYLSVLIVIRQTI